MIIVIILTVLMIAIMSMVLRSACWLYNSIADTHPKPVDFGRPWELPPATSQAFKTTDAGAYTVPGIVDGPGPLMLGNPLVPLATDPNGVPEPESGHALGICFLIAILHVAVGMYCMFMEMGGPSGWDSTVFLLSQFPINLLVQSGILATLLPTHFPRAFLVVLLQIPIATLTIVGLGAVVFFIGDAMGARMFWS